MTTQQNRLVSASPLGLARCIIEHSELIKTLTRREVVGRYRGSAMGLLWSFFNPLLMLAVYTYVFSEIFKARWGSGTGSKTEFALVLFAGLMIFNLFAECCNRAPSLILGNVGYVKKVVFPLEILPIVSLCAALFHLTISFLVWLIFYLVFAGIPSATIFLLPLVIAPLLILVLGLSWFLSSLGVYLRDVGQVIMVVTLLLMYLSPIFYPVSAMPESYRTIMELSPITFAVEQARNVMIWGKGIEWVGWCKAMGMSLAIALFGFAWFQRTRRGFADVL